MNADRILSRTFAEHEHLAPDPQAVLHALQADHATGRRRSAVAVAGTAATVAALAIGTAVLFDDRAPDPVTASSRPVATTPAAPPDRSAGHLTLAAGWLPAGRVEQVFASTGFGREYRGYQVTPATGAGIYVVVNTAPGTALPTQNKRGVARDLTIGGRPAREWSVPDWYTLAIGMPGGTVATVDLSAGSETAHVPAATMTALGRHVGAELEFDRRDPIDTTFTLSHLPAGTAVRTVTSDSSSGTRYSLGGPAATGEKPGPRSVEVAQLTDAWSVDRGKPREPATRGTPVLGRPTWVLDSGPWPALWVDEVRPGISIMLSPTGPGTTLAELYETAGGIRWTG